MCDQLVCDGIHAEIQEKNNLPRVRRGGGGLVLSTMTLIMMMTMLWSLREATQLALAMSAA